MNASVARERADLHGVHTLTDSEMVDVVLGGRGATGRGERLINMLGSVQRLAGTTARELTDVLTKVEALRVRAAVELGRRTLTLTPDELPVLRSPREVAAFLLPRYGGAPVEQFGLVLLNTKHRIVRHEVLSVGTLDASLVHPRELFKVAITHRAAAVVLFHNHPSGDPTPSVDDVALTERIVQAGALMGIEILDHLVLAGSRYFSFKEGGRL